EESAGSLVYSSRVGSISLAPSTSTVQVRAAVRIAEAALSSLSGCSSAIQREPTTKMTAISTYINPPPYCFRNHRNAGLGSEIDPPLFAAGEPSALSQINSAG